MFAEAYLIPNCPPFQFVKAYCLTNNRHWAFLFLLHNKPYSLIHDLLDSVEI